MSIAQPSKLEKEKLRLVQEKCQSLLNEMLRDDDNKYCVDCDAKGPRWASWNLGIFLCIRCAGIHRNLGVHISKVKSVNLDTWKPEQVVTMQQMGNSRARAVYEASLPDNHRRPQTDSALENFIRAKYEQKKYIAQEWVPTSIPVVNWDSEIEESIKKKKEVKKPAYGQLTMPTSVPIPKPKPVPVESKAQVQAPKKQTELESELVSITNVAEPIRPQQQASDDLFGLGGLDLSGSNDIKITSQDNPNSGQKMTKESIMSLYGNFSAPPQQQLPPQNPFATPSPMYGQQQLGGTFQQQYNQMPAHPQQQFFGNQGTTGNLMQCIQTDLSQLNLSSPQMGVGGQQNMFSTGQQNQFMGNPASIQQQRAGQGFNSNSYRPNPTAPGHFSGFGLG